MGKKHLIFLITVSITTVCLFCKKEQTSEKIDTNSNKKLQTLIEVIERDYKCENIYTNETYYATFQLKNVGKNPFYIDQISASCGCIFVEWNRQVVNPGEISEIEIEMNWNEEGYFNKSIDVYCNVDKSPIKLTVSGNVKNNTITH
jgi:archaellum component FlaG (FlaF/FlaG flagellin family)